MIEKPGTSVKPSWLAEGVNSSLSSVFSVSSGSCCAKKLRSSQHTDLEYAWKLDPLLLWASQRPAQRPPGWLHAYWRSCIMTKRALIVGCNYPGSPHQLAGCANDASSLCSLLREVFDYKPQNMLMMVDSDPQEVSPTGANIKVGSCLNMLLTCSTTDA